MGQKECWPLLINICPKCFLITTVVRGSPHPYLILVWVVFLIPVQQSVKYVLFPDLDFILKYTEILSCQCYWQKFTMAPHLSTTIPFYKKYYHTKEFPSMVRGPVLRPGALLHQKVRIMSNFQNGSLARP